MFSLKRLILVVIVSVFIIIPSFASQIIPLNGRDYFTKTLEEINQAQESIYIVMYLIDIDEKDLNGPVRGLISALNDASIRNVEVTVILEENKKNKEASLLLTSAKVQFGVPGQFIHSKVVIIDETDSILGSHNWTKAALCGNIETSVLIKDPAFSKKLLSKFSGIRKSEAPNVAIKGVKLPYSFFTGKKSVGSKLYSNHAELPFDLYLLLLRKRTENPQKKLKANYQELRESLGVSQEHLRHLLKRLESQDSLIKYDVKKRQVELTYTEPQENFIQIPFTYWDYGFSKDLPFKAKYFYLINLRERNLSKIFPWWTKNIKKLTKTYGISKHSLTDASMELQRQDIIEIYRTAPETVEFSGFRKPNRYLVKELRSEEEIKKDLAALEKRFGEKMVVQACFLASELNEPKDTPVISTFCRLIKEYGYEKVAEANAETAKLAPFNAKRHLGYTITILGKARN
ncbi:MAG: hypothetical protein HQ596_03150 [Candidatus Saganbacteria bacterium]|nr:hypothetical protein [Candidatus Saganbacteria bacterium]